MYRGYWLETKFQAVIIIFIKTSVQYCPGIGRSNIILWFNVIGVGDVGLGLYGVHVQPVAEPLLRSQGFGRVWGCEVER